MTDFLFVYVAGLMTCFMLSSFIKPSEAFRDIHIPKIAILIAVLIFSLTSWLGVALIVYTELYKMYFTVYYNFKSKRINAKMLEELNKLTLLDLKAAEDRKKFIASVLGGNLFTHSSSKKQFVKYIEQVFNIPFTTPEECVKNLNELQLLALMLYVETLVCQKILKMDKNHNYICDLPE